MPNLSYYKMLSALDKHRTAIPVDHPDFSITRSKLEYPTADVTFVYLLSIGKATYATRLWTDASGIIASDEFTDKAVESPMRDGGGIFGRDRLDGANSYRAAITTSRPGGDFYIQKLVNGNITFLSWEAVDLSDIFYRCKFSISGSTLKAYRVNLSTPKITATDTSITSGYYGIGYWDSSARPLLTMAGAILRAPSSPSPQVISYFEVPITGTGTPEDPFRAHMPELIEIEPSIDRRIFKKYEILRNKGFTDEEIMELFPEVLSIRANRLALTHSSLIKSDRTGKPQEYTSIVRVFHQPDRQPHLYPISRALDELRNMKGVRKLSREEAIRRTKQIDPDLTDVDLLPVDPKSPRFRQTLRDYIEHRKGLGVKEDMIDEKLMESYLQEDKGW